jgi:predicted PolB exonuclease-like 3'-5' exonuclease
LRCVVVVQLARQSDAARNQQSSGLARQAGRIDGGEVHRYFKDGKIQEIADYCETDIVNTYRVWLRYELFRGRLSPCDFEASEQAFAAFLKGKEAAKPHLIGMAG